MISRPSPAAPVERAAQAAGSGDLLSVCRMLLHRRDDIPVPKELATLTK